MKSEVRPWKTIWASRSLLFISAVFGLGRVHAAVDTEITASVGIIHTDNIEKTSVNRRDSFIPEFGLAGRLESMRPRIQVTMDADLTYSSFESKLYEDTSTPDRGSGAATLAVIGVLIPDRFQWEIHDTLGTGAVQQLAPDSPSNRQLTNVLSTGPTITIPLGPRGEIGVDGELFRTTYGNGTANNQGYRGNIGLTRRISRNLSLGLEASRSSIEYTKFRSLGQFDVTTGAIVFGYRGARTEGSLEVGKTQLNSILAKSSSPLVRIAFRRAVTARSSFSVRLGREYSNSAETLQSDFDFYGVASTLHGGADVAESFRADYGQIAWTHDSGQYDLGLQVLGRREVYPSGNVDDSSLYSGVVSLSRDFGARIRVGIRAAFERRNIATLPRASIERTFGADLRWRMGRTLFVLFGIERSSGTPLDLTRDYVELREFLRVSYTSGSKR